ncbi:hypothetical protein DRP53_04985 [candidate division WOR-3 bacterium]|uniref:Geranylgeranylglycerol-phosphate geranylgeranyltransferase n=1 Tax=candidate division WOR-3 bacterium TaxID=2052148 RepID=A0A660SKG7_UNCW3|nr:MAG: hypothetical protein DRP53_04985 [candidate division WOR-3 bacterium]
MIARLLRIENIVITYVSILIGGWIGTGIDLDINLILAGIAGAAAAGFGNIVNDIIDLPIDKRNNPSRPLPSGAVSLRTAKILALLFLSISIMAGFKLQRLPFLLILGSLFLLYSYSRWIKLTPFSNIMVAILATFCFLLGGLVTNTQGYLSLVPLSLCYHFGRELVKDIIDIKGDRLYGSRSLAIILGEKKAGRAAIGSIVLFTILLPLPYCSRFVTIEYLYIVSPLVPINILILRNIIIRRFTAASTLMKYGMVVALLAVLLGSRHVF